jgi:NADPH:quinone reductase
MKAIRIRAHGGHDVLRFEDIPEPRVGDDNALIRVTAAGVNFIDTYHRTGLYPVPLPFVPGQEGAGVVVETGENVTALKRGDRVAWATGPGAYAELVSLPEANLVKIPDHIADEVAAAAMLQGMTAHYLATSTYPLKPGVTCLIHAAAGGTGLLLTQIAKLRGATVIGTTSTEEKAQRARKAGADHMILYSSQDVATEVKNITGMGVDVVYDSVGKSTWSASIDSLKPRGMMVSFGNASGAVGPIDPLTLSRKGSLFLTRPTLVNYIASRAELELRANDIFNWIQSGRLDVHIDRTIPLHNAHEAHRALESRETSGKVLLIP